MKSPFLDRFDIYVHVELCLVAGGLFQRQSCQETLESYVILVIHCTI